MRKVVFFLFVLFLTFTGNCYAQTKDSFVTVANPVRGPEGWGTYNQDPLSIPKLEYFAATSSAMPVSWMLRYDAVQDASISAYFANIYAIDKTQSLGAFLEITPNLAKAAKVDYPNGISILSANRVFLSGYYPDQRKRLIDTYMDSFKNRFGFYPQSVGAWHLDSFSLDYLRSKYSVLVALICDDQYSTDGYRLWGGYLGSPYLPSKTNVLVPAHSAADRIDIVVIRWAQRDLFNFYGGGRESLFSVQVNDYLQVKQNTDYFGQLLEQYSQKDFNELTHINLGLENDYSKVLYGQEIINSYKKVVSLKNKLGLEFVSLNDLANFVLNRYPESAPTYFYQVTDPLSKSQAKIYWYQNSYYRIGLRSENGQTKIIDFRSYNDKLYEDFYATPNTNPSLFLEVPAVIDSIKYPGTEFGLDIDLSKSKISYYYSRVKFEEGNKSITLDPQDITFRGLKPAVKSKDIKVVQQKDETVWKFTGHLPLDPGLNHLSVLFAIFIPLIIVAFIFNKSLCFGLVLALLSTFTVIRSGDFYSFGLGIWGPNGHDAIFHISLIQKFASHPFDLSHPQLAGEKLSNYHFVFDYLSGLFSGITHLSADTVYFIIFPIATSIILLLLLDRLLILWKLGPLQRSAAFLFAFMAGSLGFIPALINQQNPLYSESVFWANQSSSLLLNPPFALSLIVLLIFLILLNKYQRPNIWQLILLAVVGGLLSQTKIYAFILLCIALLLTRRIKLLLTVGLVGALLTLPFSSIHGSPFDIAPLWFTRSLFASHDRVWWPKLSQAWQTYESGGIWLKLILVNLFAFVVFIIGNLSTRLLSLPFYFRERLNLSQRIALLISLAGIVLPSVIIQKINPWNTIQFIYYSLFFMGIFGALEFVKLTKNIRNKFFKTVFVIIVLTCTLFTGVGTIYSYLSHYSSSRISYTELYGLEKLRSEEYGVVLSPYFDDRLANQVPTPKPLYSYVSTAYISAFTGKPEYLSDTINLDITGYNYTVRSRQVQRFYQTENLSWAKQFLDHENISYVYETPLTRIRLSPTALCLDKIFDSGEINIYKFNCHGQN